MIIEIKNKSFYPSSINQWNQFIEHNEGKKLVLSFEEFQEKGGLGYDRFYFGFLIPSIGTSYWLDCWGKEYDKEDCHYWFKMLFHSKERIHPKTGEPMVTVKEYSKLTNKGKEEYIRKVRNHIHEKTGDWMDLPWEINDA